MHPLLAASALAAAPSFADAEAMPNVSGAQLLTLKPRHHLLPANPRGQTDFTAYTLEWGEIRIGLGNVAVGILPRTQVSTQPVLDALGAPNVSAKVDALRVGPLDLAATGTWGASDTDSVDVAWLGAGGALSLKVAQPWSVHAGVAWMRATAEGTPQLDTLALMLGQYTGSPLDPDEVDAAEKELAFTAKVEALTARVATDVRFNRRDSLILQGHAVLWSDVDMPDVAQGVVADRSGPMPVTDVYTASLAWQLSWRHVDLRLGAGVSSVPGAWLLHTVDLAYRFGGPTRGEERRMRKGWRHNKREVVKAAGTGEGPEAI